jgi:hypothetical protein
MRSGVRVVPNFWHLVYTTGFKVIPYDLLGIIGKLSSIQLFAIIGDITIGAGIASESLSFDGFSQSISTNQGSNSLYGSRIKQYAEELEKFDLPNVKSHYRGITFEVC